jgi:acetylornithine/succinyldiaminopimelate/putrescine aminotransferase
MDIRELIVNDPVKHPERLNATYERIEEVIGLTLDEENASKVLVKCKESAGIENDRALLTESQGLKVAGILTESVPHGKMEDIKHLLLGSEIATKEAVDLHEEFKIPVSMLEKDLVPAFGEGPWIITTTGKKYLDMDSNYSAANLGFNNEEVALGLFNQASQLISAKEDRVHVARTRFLKTIHGLMPEGLTQFYWQNSGGEAVDKALKIAKAYTKQTGVIAMKGGFHGRTHGAVSVTYNKAYREPFGLDKETWVHFVPFNEVAPVKELLSSGKAKIVITELLQGEEAGNVPALPDFPKRLKEVCDEYNAVLICDEVQSGFGRVATHQGEWWASQTYGVTPDIMVIGKSFGGGYPITAVVTSKEISQAMKPGYDGSTFGGNPMAMTAALIAVKQMREKDLTQNVVERSRQFVEGLHALKSPLISDIRGLGLMIGIKLPSDKHVSRFQVELKKHGIKSSLSTGDVARFLPPLIISKEEVDFALNGIKSALEALK